MPMVGAHSETNIEVGLADLAVRYDRAALVGVESDPGNLRRGRRNLAGLGERCRPVEAAVWDEWATWPSSAVYPHDLSAFIKVLRRRAVGPPAEAAEPPA